MKSIPQIIEEAYDMNGTPETKRDRRGKTYQYVRYHLRKLGHTDTGKTVQDHIAHLAALQLAAHLRGENRRNSADAPADDGTAETVTISGQKIKLQTAQIDRVAREYRAEGLFRLAEKEGAKALDALMSFDRDRHRRDVAEFLAADIIEAIETEQVNQAAKQAIAAACDAATAAEAEGDREHESVADTIAQADEIARQAANRDHAGTEALRAVENDLIDLRRYCD